MSRGETAASTTVAIHDATRVRRWQMPAADLALDERPGSPWVLVPPDVRRAFDLVAAAGRPLADTAFGTPLLGVKCGCNAAFVVDLAGDPAPGSFDEGSRSPSADVVAVRVGEPGAPARQGWVERSLLRPVVRGETLREWGRGGPRSVGDDATSRRGRGRSARLERPEWIVWTHAESAEGRDHPLVTLPPQGAAWLAPWRHRLAARTDTRGRPPWWALFRTASARCARPRVVWADIGRRPRAAVLPEGDHTVPLNTCYVVPGRDATDAHALVTLLNSDLAAAWLNAIAEPARGGFHRYLGWTVGLLPLPRDWDRVRMELAAIGGAAAAGHPPSRDSLVDAAAAAYGLGRDLVEPLLEWSRPRG